MVANSWAQVGGEEAPDSMAARYLDPEQVPVSEG